MRHSSIDSYTHTHTHTHTLYIYIYVYEDQQKSSICSSLIKTDLVVELDEG